jgi:hypothetical protein
MVRGKKNASLPVGETENASISHHLRQYNLQRGSGSALQ